MANQKNDENNASFLTPEQENVGMSLEYFTNQGPPSDGITFDKFRSVMSSYEVPKIPSFYPAHQPSTPQPPLSSHIPVVTPQQNTSPTISDIQKENADLRNRLIAQEINHQRKTRQDYHSAEAYSEVSSTSNGLCVLDKNRREHIVFPLRLRQCVFVDMDSLYEVSSFYYIDFKSSIEPLVVSEKEFRSPSTLAHRIESHFKETISLCGPKGKIYSGIQSLLSREAEHVHYPFYSGWLYCKENSKWTYRTFNRSTHGIQKLPMNAIDISRTATSLPSTPAVQLTAGVQFAEMMTSIKDDSLRHLFTGIVHIASLYSLFSGLNHRISFGFCLSSDSLLPLEAMECLFSWFGDERIQLSESKNRFSNLLIERKDQPVLVWDEAAQITNSHMLEQAIKTGVIVNGKTERELHALPIVLSQMTTHLTKSPELIHIAVSADSVFPDMIPVIRDRYHYFMDYLQYFNLFVQEHQTEFADMIVSSLDVVAQEMAAFTFPKAIIEMLAAFRAVDHMARQYYHSLSPHRDAMELFENLFTDGFNAILLESLRELCCLDSNDTIAKLFFDAANQMIKDGLFDIREFGGPQTFAACPQDKAGIVYIHNNEPCFTTEAYNNTVKQTGYKPGTLKQALSSIGAFKGAKTNANAFQTRIRGYNPATGQGFTSVYRFSRDDIFLPITPLISDPGDWIKSPTESRIQLELGRSIDGFDMVWHGIENCHACITGRSGTGKSYFLKKAIAQLPSQNTRCIIFDTSGEFSNTPDNSAPDAWNSTEIEVVDMRDTQVQTLFFRPLSSTDTPEIIASRFTETLNRRFHFGRNQQDNLFGAVMEAFRQKDSPIFNDLLPHIPYPQVTAALNRLSLMLPFGSNKFDWKFDTPGITVLNFQNGSDDAVRGTALELLLSSICAQQMNVPQDDYPSVVLAIDECQLLGWKKGSHAYDIMVRGRKYGLSMWLSTQTLSQIDNPTIPEQADLRVFFKPADSEISHVIRNLCIADKKEKDQCKIDLSNLVRGQFLCKLNGHVYVSTPPEL